MLFGAATDRSTQKCITNLGPEKFASHDRKKALCFSLCCKILAINRKTCILENLHRATVKLKSV